MAMKFLVNEEGVLVVEGTWPSDAIGATKESIRAWQTRLDALKQGKGITKGSADECALCQCFCNKASNYYCFNCPLYHMQGKQPCGPVTIWGEWHSAWLSEKTQSQKNAAEKMISILEKTLVHLVMESEGAPKAEKVAPPPPPKPEPLKFGGKWEDEEVHSPAEFYVKLEKSFNKNVFLVAVNYMGENLSRNFLLSLSHSTGITICSSVNKDILEAFGGGDARKRLIPHLE
jgi:hypothetical protein